MAFSSHSVAVSALVLLATTSAHAETRLPEPVPSRVPALFPVLKGTFPAAIRTEFVLGKRRSKHPEAPDSPSSERSRVLTTGTGRYAHKFFEVGAFGGARWLTASRGQVGGATGGPTYIGLRFADNDIFIGRLFFAMLAGAARAQTHTQVSSTYEYRADGLYKVTTYRPLTDQEIAERDAAMAEAMAGRYVGEFSVYIGGLNGWEYRVGESNPLTKSDLPILFQMGLILAHMSSKDLEFRVGEGHNSPPGVATGTYKDDLFYSNIGVWLRVIAPLSQYFEIEAGWDLNLMQIAWNAELKQRGMIWNSPFRVGAQFNLSDWVYARAEAVATGLSAETIGTRYLFGLRF